MRVVGRVVVPGDGAQSCASFQFAGLGEAVTQLPVKVIVDAEQRLDGVVVVEDVVFEALAAQVHVGEEAEQSGVVGERAFDFDAVVGGAGRNQKRVII